MKYRNQLFIKFTTSELEEIRDKAQEQIPHATSKTNRGNLQRIIDITTEAIKFAHSLKEIPLLKRIYQFKITLLRSEPPIWRRIQVKDCTLDRLHDHIQTAMDWTNSHLRQFHIEDQLYGDPELMQENFGELGYIDSTITKISNILPPTGERFTFYYEYDFGDSWNHEILFEGQLRAEPQQKYPLCVEGERACPPEDVGGIYGYQEFLSKLADPGNPERAELLEWVGGSFDPEAFDTERATKAMRNGLPDWRSQQWF